MTSGILNCHGTASTHTHLTVGEQSPNFLRLDPTTLGKTYTSEPIMGAHTSVFTDEFKDPLEVVEEQVRHEECSLRACVDSVWFEIVVASLIIVNTVVMAVEAQYHGNDTGYAMEYPGANTSAVAAWPWVGNLPRIGT